MQRFTELVPSVGFSGIVDFAFDSLLVGSKMKKNYRHGFELIQNVNFGIFLLWKTLLQLQRKTKTINLLKNATCWHKKRRMHLRLTVIACGLVQFIDRVYLQSKTTVFILIIFDGIECCVASVQCF